MAELDHECSTQLLAFREGGANFLVQCQAKALRANGGPCWAEPSAGHRRQLGQNRDNTTHKSPVRSGGGASDAGAFFGKPQVVDEARGSPPAGPHGVRKLEATKAKRATKRELIVVAP